jgi:hypothetical protein
MSFEVLKKNRDSISNTNPKLVKVVMNLKYVVVYIIIVVCRIFITNSAKAPKHFAVCFDYSATSI